MFQFTSIYIYTLLTETDSPLLPTKASSGVPECKEKLAASQDAAADAAGQAVLEDAVGVLP